MYYIGVDLHKERSWFHVTDASGKKILSKSISNKPCVVKEFFKTLPRPSALAVESTYNWYFFVDIAQEYAREVYLADSYALKAFAKKHKKTDKIDAKLIADVLRKGYLPTVTIPDKATRQLKEVLKYRMNLVRDRVRNIVQLKSVLDKLGENSNGDFTTYKRLGEILTEHLPLEYQEVIKGYIERIGYLTEKLYVTKSFINSQVCKDKYIGRLITIPGISFFSAALIKSIIIDINRFATFNRLCAYAGLAPRIHQSAKKTIRGPLNVNRSKYLQWILIEVVYHFIKATPDKMEKYLAIKKRKGANTAKVVLARDLLKVIYHVLKENRDFYVKKGQRIRTKVAPALCGV